MATRKPGKVIDTIEYREKGVLIKVDLRMVKDDYDRYRYCVRHDNPRVELDDVDPTSLRKRTIEALREAVVINWTRMIRIDTKLDFMAHSGWGSESADYLHGLEGQRQLSIDLRGYEVGTTHGNKPVFRFRAIDGHACADRHTSEGYPVRDGHAALDDSQALIPDTEENRAKLRSVIEAFELLSARLRELLGQKNIGHTLENVRLLGLPGATSTEDKS